MKNLTLSLVLLFALNSFSQVDSPKLSTYNNPYQLDTIKYPIDRDFNYFDRKAKNDNRNDSIRYFSVTPIYRKNTRVDGLAIGVGHFENKNIKKQTVNGLNLEASPTALALIPFLHIPIEGLFVGLTDKQINNVAFFDNDYATYIKINGLNVSSGGFMGGAQVNGLNVSVFSGMNEMNGFSLNATLLGTKSFKGLAISGIANITDYGKGVQIAISNVSRNHKGVQIGLFNHSKNLRGFQFGLWNTNGKRKLPFINWQFKE
jgi:hypothetical protein